MKPFIDNLPLWLIAFAMCMIALCAFVALCLLITSHRREKRKLSSASLTIYQPRALFLKEGVPVPTREGIHTPQTDEIWHSAAAYNALESQLINAAAALAQKTMVPKAN
jgi:hypothetical protein